MRLVLFFEGILTRERAYQKRLVGLGVLLNVNASCRVFRTHLDEGACLSKASCRSWRLVKRKLGLVVFLWTRLDKGACLSKASCRSWRLVMSECGLFCFLKASWQGSVPIESVLSVLASCCERMRLVVFLWMLFDKVACLSKASCRSWSLVMSECVWSCFPNASWQESVPIKSVL